jgi:hypothetical protein
MTTCHSVSARSFRRGPARRPRLARARS